VTQLRVDDPVRVVVSSVVCCDWSVFVSDSQPPSFVHITLYVNPCGRLWYQPPHAAYQLQTSLSHIHVGSDGFTNDWQRWMQISSLQS